MKQHLLGRFPLGTRDVEVFWNSGSDGGFSQSPKSGPGSIEVGISGEWWAVVRLLLHEATEFVLYDMGCRWRPNPDYGRDHSDYLFVLHHHKFSEAIGRVSLFIAECLPELAKIYNKHSKRKPKS